VEGLSRPLRLTLTGTCVALPASRDVYHVTTSVRQREVKSLPVPNHSSSLTYNLRPVVDGAGRFCAIITLGIDGCFIITISSCQSAVTSDIVERF